MYVCECVYMYIYIYVYMYIYIHTYIYICMYVCMYVYISNILMNWWIKSTAADADAYGEKNAVAL